MSASQSNAAALFETHAPAMQRAVQTLRKVANVDLPVLLYGPSGNGKTATAQALHAISSRKAGPCVTLHCGSVPDSLLESELFGHVQGAFTSAHKDNDGVFLRADGGTLILDEIGAASPAMQVALLRAVEEKRITPLGANEARRVDVRLVATTSLDLLAAVEAGRFRSDLYYRIAVVPLYLPALDERREDIAFLAQHLLQRACDDWRITPPRTLDAQTVARLERRPWPGGIRELDNVLRRAVALAPGETLTADLFEWPNDTEEGAEDTDRAQTALPLSTEEWVVGERIAVHREHFSLRQLQSELEDIAIARALEHCHGNQRQAAELLEISLRNLVYKLSAQRNKEHNEPT